MTIQGQTRTNKKKYKTLISELSPLAMAGFYYLPEDRLKEQRILEKEAEAARNKRAQRKYPQDPTSILVLKLRTAIENGTPKALSQRASIRKQFSLFDSDSSGVVDFQEFKGAIKKYLNGAEEEDIRKIFNHFDTDKSGTLSVEEFSDLLLKEEGPHNYSHKEYNKIKPEKAPSRVTSSKGLSQIPASVWTGKIRGVAVGPYSKGSNATTRVTKSTRLSNATSVETEPKDLRFAQRELEGKEPVTQKQIDTRLGNLIIEERRVIFLRQFRVRVEEMAGKENGSQGIDAKIKKVDIYKSAAANTLHWVLSTYAAASKQRPRLGKIGKRRFLAALDVFRPKKSPPYDQLATESLWEKCHRGDIKEFVRQVFLYDTSDFIAINH